MTKPKPKTSILRILALGIPAALIALGVRGFVFGLFVVPTSSMVPTLLTGDYIIASKWGYGSNHADPIGKLIERFVHVDHHAPQRGDVLVFKEPGDNPTIMVKRVIGVPGDTVQMYQSELYVNRRKVKRIERPQIIAFPGDDEKGGDIADYDEYLPSTDKPHIIRLIRGLESEETVNNTPEIVVPPGGYFFMGDNRDNSDDSRVGDVGFVPERNILGKAETTFFSMSHAARLWEYKKWSWSIRWNRLWKPIQ